MRRLSLFPVFPIFPDFPGLVRSGSALALLVTRVGTQDAHHALAAHNLAILADLFY
jgi:hypothetical protein